jgi:exonuclease V gamma subunit
MLCWLAPPGVPLATRVLGLADNAPAEVVFAPVAKPDERLATLVELFLQGQERLLPLPPKTAQAFVEKRLKSDDLTQALTEAEKTYVSTFGPCERDEAWVRHALRGALPWYDEGLFSAEEFAAVAEAIFLPMLLHENTTAQSLTRQEEP